MKSSRIALKRKEMPLESIFIARMDILGHKFIIRCNGHLSPKLQEMWFNDITEVLGVNGLQK